MENHSQVLIRQKLLLVQLSHLIRTFAKENYKSAVCIVHKEMRSTDFLAQPPHQGRQVFWFGPQNWQPRFGDLAYKITATVFLFRP
jgi:hypothetical protein